MGALAADTAKYSARSDIALRFVLKLTQITPMIVEADLECGHKVRCSNRDGRPLDTTSVETWIDCPTCLKRLRTLAGLVAKALS